MAGSRDCNSQLTWEQLSVFQEELEKLTMGSLLILFSPLDLGLNVQKENEWMDMLD